MMQDALFHESVNDALRAAVQALGGHKKIGAAMRPELPADQAGSWLRDCLNPDRREKLSPEQVVWVLREARRIGYHGAATYILHECGYAEATPVEPEDERAQLQRMFIESVKAQNAITERMERLMSASSVTSIGRAR
jgi:hypothetical protein